MTKRHINDWLQELPDESREMALLYFKVYHANNPGIKVMRDSVGDALMAAFPWHRTKHGSRYWLEVYTQVTKTLMPCVPSTYSNTLIHNNKKFNNFFDF
jgi:hypothetical protein